MPEKKELKMLYSSFENIFRFGSKTHERNGAGWTRRVAVAAAIRPWADRAIRAAAARRTRPRQRTASRRYKTTPATETLSASGLEVTEEKRQKLKNFYIIKSCSF